MKTDDRSLQGSGEIGGFEEIKDAKKQIRAFLPPPPVSGSGFASFS